jgi:hypothetical protein
MNKFHVHPYLNVRALDTRIRAVTLFENGTYIPFFNGKGNVLIAPSIYLHFWTLLLCVADSKLLAVRAYLDSRNLWLNRLCFLPVSRQTPRHGRRLLSVNLRSPFPCLMFNVLETVLHPEDSTLELVSELCGIEHPYRIKLWLLGVAGQLTGLQRSALCSSPHRLSPSERRVLEEGEAIF